MQWRLVSSVDEIRAARDGAWNMAVDEVLAQSVAIGAPPVLRLYTWSPACISLGRNQPAGGRFDTRLARRRGIDIVRRPTGGLAVYHDRELTYAVAMPVALFGGPRRSYRAINCAIVSGLRRLGVVASIAGNADSGAACTATGNDGATRTGVAPLLASARRGEGSAAAWRGPCFREAARGEVIAGGRKLVGSAQRREHGVILQHGSILIAGDQSPVLELQHLTEPVGTRSVTLYELLGRCPDIHNVASAVAAGFENHGGIRFAADSLTREERRHASRLSDRYRSDAWTWRR